MHKPEKRSDRADLVFGTVSSNEPKESNNRNLSWAVNENLASGGGFLTRPLSLRGSLEPNGLHGAAWHRDLQIWHKAGYLSCRLRG